MKSIHVLLMTLLATASAASAQTPPPLPPTPNYPFSEALEEAQEAEDCCECPFAKAMRDVQTALQRLRTMCGAAQAECGVQGCCKGCCTGAAAGCAKGSDAQPAKACSCAKGCSCCETCKSARTGEKAQAEQAQMPMPCPLMPAAPAPMIGWRMHAGPAVFQMVAQSAGTAPIVMSCPAPVVKPVKLETPDFEAHCDQMIHRGDTIQLVGHVLLLCKKHAQPLRIEGERIVLNLNDGSFVVEAGPALPRLPVPTMGFGVMRTTTFEGGNMHYGPCQTFGPVNALPAYDAVCPTNAIEVVPVPPTPVTCPRPR